MWRQLKWIVVSTSITLLFVITLLLKAEAVPWSIVPDDAARVSFNIDGAIKPGDHATVYQHTIREPDDKNDLGERLASTQFRASVPYGVYRYTFQLDGHPNCILRRVVVTQNTTLVCTFS